jgi:ABC-2 type transport system ATP-binding protein
MMTTAAIDVDDLRRSYRTSTGLVRRRSLEVAAVRGVSFQVARGEIFGLVGPNGAGKTTLIKVLTTLLLPTSGTARVLGYDVGPQAREIRRRINFVYGGERGLYWRLSAEDNLRYFADLYQVPVREGRARVAQLLELVGLADRRKERVEGFSKGMKQRLHLAKSLINEPEILFLDEPSIGLDPVAARSLRSLIQRVRAERGTTVLLTSHYMWEMETLSDRIAVIIDGTIRYLDAPAALRTRTAGSHVVEVVLGDDADEAGVRARLGGHGPVLATTVSGRRLLHLHTSDPQRALADLGNGAAPGVSGHSVRDSQLEDAYLLVVQDAGT